jgi:hypothetical protein
VAASSSASGRQLGCETADLTSRVRAQRVQPLEHAAEELARACPRAPVRGSDSLLVQIELVSQGRLAEPAPALRGIHQLHEPAMATPHDHEVRHALAPHDEQGRKRASGRQQQVIDREHHLLGFEAKGRRDLLDGVD